MRDKSAEASLRVLAERAESDAAYLASALRSFAHAEQQSLETVIERLGVAHTVSSKFRLCLRPTGERFAEMLRAISTRFSVDESALLSLLRQVDVLEAFVSPQHSHQELGVLLAARSHDDDDTRQAMRRIQDSAKPKRQRERTSSDDGDGGTQDPEDDDGAG